MLHPAYDTFMLLEIYIRTLTQKNISYLLKALGMRWFCWMIMVMTITMGFINKALFHSLVHRKSGVGTNCASKDHALFIHHKTRIKEKKGQAHKRVIEFPLEQWQQWDMFRMILKSVTGDKTYFVWFRGNLTDHRKLVVGTASGDRFGRDSALLPHVAKHYCLFKSGGSFFAYLICPIIYINIHW